METKSRCRICNGSGQSEEAHAANGSCYLCGGSGIQPVPTGKLDTIEEQLKAANIILKDLIRSKQLPYLTFESEDEIIRLREQAIQYMQRWGVQE